MKPMLPKHVARKLTKRQRFLAGLFLEGYWAWTFPGQKMARVLNKMIGEPIYCRRSTLEAMAKLGVISIVESDETHEKWRINLDYLMVDLLANNFEMMAVSGGWNGND